MQKYFISQCCQKPVGTIIRGRAVCPECKKINGIIDTGDTPGGVPKEETLKLKSIHNPCPYGNDDCKICGRKGGHILPIQDKSVKAYQEDIEAGVDVGGDGVRKLKASELFY
jgi:hypothetical protein